jgi:hypothetical protein
MAKRKRRKSSRRRARRNPAAAVARSNPRHRRRRARRNPPFRMGGIVGRITDAGKGALFMVGGEATTRFIRHDLLKMADGQTMSTVADAGVGVALGMLAERFVGRQAARDMTAGALAYIARSVAKQLGITKLNEILGDAGVRRFTVRNGKLVPLAGYPRNGNARLAGYVRGNGSRGATQALEDERAMGLA